MPEKQLFCLGKTIDQTLYEALIRNQEDRACPTNGSDRGCARI